MNPVLLSSYNSLLFPVPCLLVNSTLFSVSCYTSCLIICYRISWVLKINLTNSQCPNLLFPIFVKLFLPLTQVPPVLFLFLSSHNCSGQFIQIGLLIPYHPYSCIGLQFHFNDYSLHSSLKHNEFCFSMCISIVPALRFVIEIIGLFLHLPSLYSSLPSPKGWQFKAGLSQIQSVNQPIDNYWIPIMCKDCVRWGVGSNNVRNNT